MTPKLIPDVEDSVQEDQTELQDQPKPSGYNLDFLDNLDDPNFNPFATKSKVSPDEVFREIA